MTKRAIPAVVLNEVFGDLSDGAYFAVMEEFGADPYALADAAPPGPRERQCPECKRRFTGRHALRQHRRDKHTSGAPHE